MKLLIFIFILGLSIENILRGFIQVQTFSLALLIAPAVLVTNFRKINFKDPNLIFVLTLLSYGFIVFVASNSKYGQFSPLIRQIISLVGGICLYLATIFVNERLSFKEISSTTLLCSIPALMIGIFQKITGIGSFALGRVSSLFSEPSHFGDYLVLLVAPFLFYEFINLQRRSKNNKISFSIVSTLWVTNLIIVQSGTALLKICSLILLIFIFYPKLYKQKIIALTILSSAIFTAVFIKNSYVQNSIFIGIDIIKNPTSFMNYHTFYDRFYPIYGVCKLMAETKNFFGFGLGSDFFEWKNIFLPTQYHAQLILKPSGSYLNSNFSKVILYFGLLGCSWIIYLFRKAFKLKSPLLKIYFLNILITCFWGISSFSQPYLWFWLATVEVSNKRNDDEMIL